MKNVENMRLRKLSLHPLHRFMVIIKRHHLPNQILWIFRYLLNAATKKSLELISYTYCHLFDMNITALRFFTVYGPDQRPEMAIHKFGQAILEGKSFPFYGDGSTARDYTYIDDIVDGIVRCMERVDGYQLFNLGNNVPISLIDLVKILEETLDKKAIYDQLPMQPGDVDITWADITRAKQRLGYDPKTPFKEGIAHFCHWLLKKKWSINNKWMIILINSNMFFYLIQFFRKKE